MPKIDFHFHAYPPAIAARIIETLSRSAQVVPHTDGTLADGLQKERQWGIDRVVLLNVASTPKQQKNANELVIQANGGNVISFGAVHPLAQDAVYYLDMIRDAGLPGIKLHPEYQMFDADDRAVYPIYEYCANHGLIVLFHGGSDPAFPEGKRACPERIARVAKDFPGLKIVDAHMGDSVRTKDTLTHLCGTDIYMDISMTYLFLPPSEMRGLIERHGAEKILFGTDCPWGNGAQTIAYLESIGLSQEQKELIYYKNAERLLGITL